MKPTPRMFVVLSLGIALSLSALAAAQEKKKAVSEIASSTTTLKPAPTDDRTLQKR